MTDLTFGRFHRANVARAKEWHGSTNWSVGQWVTALVGELGEACNVIKKIKQRGRFYYR